jgi:hypothetical protein
MRRNLHLAAGIVCISWAFGACSSDSSSGDDDGNGGTSNGGTGGSGGSSGSGMSGSGGTVTNGGGGSGGTSGGTGGSGGSLGGAGGSSGATGGGGTGGTPVIPPYCENQTAKMPPFLITTLGAYVPSGWFPATGPADMTDIGCPSTGGGGVEDAGAGDASTGAGDAGTSDASAGNDASAPAMDAGELPTFTQCLGISYEQADPLNVFAGINWVPAVGVSASCFTGVGAVEFWASGTPGETAIFEAFGEELPVVLTAEWQKYSIAINTNLNASGVPIAFTMKFDAANGTGPFNAYVANITYVE